MTASQPIARRNWRVVPAVLMAVSLLAGSLLLGEQEDSAAPAESAGEVTLHGRVLLPDGKPAAGADVYWLQLKKAEPPAKSEIWWLRRAVADGEGRFQWTLEKTDARFGPANRPPIVARKAGFGLGGLPINCDDASAEITLRLVEDQPIRGRLIDTEGRPLAGANVAVATIQNPRDGGLDRFLDVSKRQRHDAQGMLGPALYLTYCPLRDGLVATTDEGGRFELTGAGAERLITLSVTAPGYMSEEIKVVTRHGFDAERYNSAARAEAPAFMRTSGRIPQIMGPTFDRVLEAELADCWPHTFRIAEPTCTIYGLGADRPRRVCILHPERRFAASLTLTSAEAGPVTVRLAAPASIEGRALDAGGEPLADAQVQINYARESASELLRFVELEKGQVRTDRDGRFHVDIVPGERFALDFRHDDHYYRAPLNDEQRTLKAGQKLELGDMKPKFIQ